MRAAELLATLEAAPVSSAGVLAPLLLPLPEVAGLLEEEPKLEPELEPAVGVPAGALTVGVETTGTTGTT